VAASGIGPHGVPQVEPLAAQAKAKAARSAGAEAGSREGGRGFLPRGRRSPDEGDGPEVSELAAVAYELKEMLRLEPRRFAKVLFRSADAIDRAADRAVEARRGLLRGLAEGLRQAGLSEVLPALQARSPGGGGEGGPLGHLHSYASAQARGAGLAAADVDLARVIREAMDAIPA